MKTKHFRFNTVYAVFLFVFMQFVFSCSSGNINKTEEEKDRETMLKYDIKRITEKKTVFFGGIEKKETVSCIRLFDENGLKIKEEQYDWDGLPDYTVSYQYDKNGNLVLATALNRNGELAFRETRIYDDNNNRKEQISYLPDGTFKYKNTAVYDKERKMLELSWFRPDGFKSKNIFTYNGNQKTEDTEYGPEGEFRYKWVYKYDYKGNLTEAVQYYPGNIINGKITYQYTRFNKVAVQINYFGETKQGKITYEYDKKTLLLSVKTEYTSTDVISARFRYQYEFY